MISSNKHKRNLLAIVDSNPFPASDGKTYPIEGQLNGLAKWWNIDFLEVRKPGAPHGFDTKTHHEIARHVRRVDVPKAAGKFQRLTGELLSGKPYFLQPTADQKTIAAAIGANNYDAIYVSPLGLADWATAVASCVTGRPKLILNQNDSITERFRRDYDLFKLRVLSWKNSAKHLLQSLRAIYMSRIEKRIYSQFDLILVQTQKDEEAIISDVGEQVRDKLVLAPNGIKESLLSLQYDQHDAQRLLHIGGLSRNRRDLVFWFLKEVFLPTRQKLPRMTIQLAGSISEADARSLRSMPGVETLGFIDDVKDVLSQATMSIAPLFMRTGLVNKVLDSMAAGVPSSGTKAFNGLPGFENGVHGFDVEDAHQWRQLLCDTLVDSETLARVSEAGRQLVTDNLRWELTVNRIHQRICNLIDESPDTHPTHASDESLVA